MNQEDRIHTALCRYIAHQYPRALFNTDLSGIRLPMSLARKAARLRSSRAYPDLVIYESRGNFSALFIEIKSPGTKIWLKDGSLTKNKHIREQAEMLQALRNRGFLSSFAVGLDEAITLVDWYLDFSKLDDPYPLKPLKL